MWRSWCTPSIPQAAGGGSVTICGFAKISYGDVVKLCGTDGGFPLRVGEWQWRFDFTEKARASIVHVVLPRGNAYKRREGDRGSG